MPGNKQRLTPNQMPKSVFHLGAYTGAKPHLKCSTCPRCLVCKSMQCGAEKPQFPTRCKKCIKAFKTKRLVTQKGETSGQSATVGPQEG